MRGWWEWLVLAAAPMAAAHGFNASARDAATSTYQAQGGEALRAQVAHRVLAHAYAQASDIGMTAVTSVSAGQPMAANRVAKQPKPRTRSSTAQRFYMEQNGKRMSARDFDAWMKSRGIRVATGKPGKPAPKRKRGN